MKNKKIIFYVTRQYMKRNKKRTLTTLFGIMLMVMLMTCVFVGKDTAWSYLIRVAEKKSGSWHMRVYDANEEQYEKVKKLDYIKKTGISYDIGFSKCKESKNIHKPYWDLKAYSAPCFEWMNIRMEKGRLPKKENEVIVSQNVLKDGAKLKIGDTIKISAFSRSIKGINSEAETTEIPLYGISLRYKQTLQVPQNFPFYAENNDFKELHTKTGFSNTYTIVGIMEAPVYETTGVSFYSAITYTPNQMGDRDKVNVTCRFDLKKSIRDDIFYDMQNIMGNELGTYEENDLLLLFSEQSSESYMNMLVKFLIIFFVLFILMVSMILIYNVFNISYGERCRYLGMLSSVGATKQQKCSSVYYEVFFLLLFALPIGILLGLGMVKAGMLMLRPYIFQLENFLFSKQVGMEAIQLVITPTNLLLVFLVSVITVWVSAIIPAHKIGKAGAIESIRGTVQTRKKRYRSKKQLLKRGKIEALLAYNDLHRQKGKGKGIIRAVAVFFVVLTVTSFGASAITKMVHYRLVEDASIRDHMDDYDYCVFEQKKEIKAYEQIKKELQSDPSVEETREWYTGMFVGFFSGKLLNKNYWDAYQAIGEEYGQKKVKRQNNMTLSVLGVDEDTFAEIAKNCGCSQEMLNRADCPGILYQNIQMSTDNLIFGSASPKHYCMFELGSICDKKPGELFPMSVYNPKTEQGEKFAFTLAGYADREDVEKYVSFCGEHIWMITRNDVAEKLNQIIADKDDLNSEEDGRLERELYVKFSDSNSSLAQALAKSEEAGEQDLDFGIRKPGKQMLETFCDAFDEIIKVISVCFVSFTGFICLLNLYNSIRERAITRKRELAMLRSVGMEERQMLKMLFWENIGIWGRSVIWAAVFSFPIVSGIGKVLKRYFGEIALPFPGMVYGAALVFTLLSLLLFTWLCYYGKEKENLLEQMRMENL